MAITRSQRRNAEAGPSDEDREALAQRRIIIGHKIGSGAFSSVYLAETNEMGRDKKLLACKIFDQSKVPNDYRDKFFPRELNILMQISHPFIVQLYSILQKGPKVFILMCYAESGDLFTWIHTHGAIPEGLAHRWFKQLLAAFEYLHSRDIAHRDLKCENILLSKNFNIKLADFGFARYCLGVTGQRELSRTFCGSAAYAAPEIVSGKPYNPKLADVWSLGVVLYIMLNSVMPFDDDNLPRLLDKQVRKKWTFHKKVSGTLSRDVKHLIGKILEPDVTKRLSLGGIGGHGWIREEFPIGAGDSARGCGS